MTRYLRPYHRPRRSELYQEEVVPDEQLRRKLLQISSSFTALGKRVDEDVRQRKELENRSCQELLAFLQKLENELLEESRAREMELLHLRQAIEQQLNEMVTGLQARISERFSKLFSSVEALTDRCSHLELGIRQFKGEVPSQLQVDFARLKEAMGKILEDFKREQQQAVAQEEAFLQRIDEGGFSVDAEAHKELNRLERRAEALQELMDLFAVPEDGDQERRVLAQIEQLRLELEAEVAQRGAADDEVAQAINDYRVKIHRSLTASS